MFPFVENGGRCGAMSLSRERKRMHKENHNFAYGREKDIWQEERHKIN